MSNELIEEIREDVRREELLRLWKKYGKHIVAGVSVILVAAFIYAWREHHLNTQKISDARQYESILALLKEKQGAEAVAALDRLASGDNKTYALLSLFKKAAISENSREELEKIINDKKIESSFRELAILVLASREIDTGPSADLIEKLKTVANSNSTWRAMANELLAMSFFRSRQPEQGIKILENLVEDKLAPEGVRMRARIMLEYIHNS